MLDRFTAWAQRSRLPSFLTLARTIRAHRDGILAALGTRINKCLKRYIARQLYRQLAAGFPIPPP